jgi:hypothetical protein
MMNARTVVVILSAKIGTTEGFVMTPVTHTRAFASLLVNATKSRQNKNKEKAYPSRGWLHKIEGSG